MPTPQQLHALRVTDRPMESKHPVTVAHYDLDGGFRLAILCWTEREVVTAIELAYHADSVHVRPFTR